MTVLRDGTGQQHREGDNTRGKQGDEQQMWSRLGNDAHQNGQQNHPWDVFANQLLQVEIVKPDLDDKQRTEGPKEDAKEMLADDVLPQVFLDKVLGSPGDKPHDE